MKATMRTLQEQRTFLLSALILCAYHTLCAAQDSVISSCPSVDSITVRAVGTTHKRLSFIPPTCNGQPVTCTPSPGFNVLNAVKSIICTCFDTQGQSHSCSVSLITRIDPCPQTQVISLGSQLVFTSPHCYDSIDNSLEVSTCNPSSRSFPTSSSTATCHCSSKSSVQCMFDVTVESQVITGPCNPDPCNGGICNVVNSVASCDCSATAFIGQFCNTPIEIQFQGASSVTLTEGAPSVNRIICLNPPSARSFDVSFSLSSSPSNTQDLSFPTTSSIPARQTCTSVQFSAEIDERLEGTETFLITLSSNRVNVDEDMDQFTIDVVNLCNPHPCNLGVCSVNNNAASCDCSLTVFFGEFCTTPFKIQFQLTSSVTITEGASPVNRIICLNPLSTRSFDVSFSLSSSPSNTQDLSFPTTSSIPARQTCTSVQFSAVIDERAEGTETFQISLSSNFVTVDEDMDQFTISIVNPCNPDPCKNGGECSVISSAASCDCSPTAFWGQSCTTPIEIQFQETSAAIAEGSSKNIDVCIFPRMARNFALSFSLSSSPSSTGDLSFLTTSSISASQTCTSVQFSASTDGRAEGTETYQITLSSTSVNVDDQITIVVTDTNTPPNNPVCPNNMDFINSGNGAQVHFTIPTCFDVEEQTTLTSVCTSNSGDRFTAVSTLVRCTCTDLSRSSSSCTFTISVKGVQCPSNRFGTIPIGSSVTTVQVTWTEPNNPTSFRVMSRTYDSGAHFPVGETTVTYTFEDQANNIASCSFTVTVIEDCTVLNSNPSCDNASCQCGGEEMCSPDFDTCSRNCAVFGCPAGLLSSIVSKVNPQSSVDINCSLMGSTTLLDKFVVMLSRNFDDPLDTGRITLTSEDMRVGSRQKTYRVTNVTEEDDLYCVLVKDIDNYVVGRVNVKRFLYKLPSLSAAPTLITKSNTTVTVQWNAWDPATDDGDPPVVHYFPYYCMNSSDDWMHSPVEVLSEETLEFRAENLEIDTFYDFSVAAVREGDNGEGPRSPPVTVKTFCNVSEITADVTAIFTLSNEINISWLLPPGKVMCSTGVTKFTVYYKIEGSSDERLEMAGIVDDDTSIRWFVIDGRSLLSATKYSFFVTFTTDQESLLSEKTEDSVLEVPLFSTAPAPLYLISLIIIPILLIAVVIVFFIVRYQRNTGFKDNKTTKTDDGEDEDYVNAAIADDSQDYIPLEKQSETISSSKYEDLNNKPQSSLSIPSQYEVTIVPERQRPVAPPRIQTRNMKGINSGAYEDVGASSENRQLPNVPQSDPSGDKDEDNSYEVPDRLEEYTGVYVNVKNKNKLKQPESIKVAEFEKFMSRTKEDIVRDIIHQFMSLPSGRQYPWSVAVKFQNKPRNFFKTILPYDHSRVRLDTAGSDARSDYINASYIKNRQGKTSFIAAQGPQEGTVDDFWKMVWQENVEIIVMVTDTSEENKSLCSTYWPSKVHTSKVFDNITVLLMESTSYTTHTIRKLNLFKGNPKPEVHVVTQVHVHSWPYGGVPKETTSLMSIVKEVKTWQIEEGSCPLLVHCSNGVGATGTFIAIYVLMDIIRKNKDISVFDFVAKMREDRVDIVQTRIQYLFIFEFLLTVLQSTDSEILCDQLRKLGHAAIKLKSKKEFKVLQESTVKRQQVENCIGYSPENQHKNRFTSIVPDDEFRPVLKSQGNSYGCNSYINAFHLADFGGREFIMTQTPLTSTVEDFWRLVYDYGCTAIVMLNDVGGSDETLVQYWPGGGSMQYGLMKVVCTVTTKNDSYVHRQFQVAHKKIEEKSICVDHFAFCGWSGNHPDIPKLKQFIRYTRNKGPGPVLVHCINGIGLSGVYIIVATEIERLESRDAVDVCQSLQRLRKKCSFAIQSQEEYALCYQILKDHLDNPEEYAVVY